MAYKALSSFRYGTRMLTAGDEFDAPQRDGRALVAVGRAVYLTKNWPAPKPRATPKPKRMRRKKEAE